MIRGKTSKVVIKGNPQTQSFNSRLNGWLNNLDAAEWGFDSCYKLITIHFFSRIIIVAYFGGIIVEIFSE